MSFQMELSGKVFTLLTKRKNFRLVQIQSDEIYVAETMISL